MSFTSFTQIATSFTTSFISFYKFYGKWDILRAQVGDQSLHMGTGFVYGCAKVVNM